MAYTRTPVLELSTINKLKPIPVCFVRALPLVLLAYFLWNGGDTSQFILFLYRGISITVTGITHVCHSQHNAIRFPRSCAIFTMGEQCPLKPIFPLLGVMDNRAVAGQKIPLCRKRPTCGKHCLDVRILHLNG
ncbi:uncharacterized protein C8R40DRAFT_616196 [Lentinula edodes]|uniref:uncharacterized protein n=1 Tax=Lentinula edodes TaxID=5353 RepID=UPI001E8E451F|nr:uncharacterized protein C8R40DRAFT_616196 [Lentinula edodes]KAH7870923.1 hypothetical protein C8R40DRAFT_616196 [Lentinula edodes]